MGPSDPADDRALRALALSRSTGAPLLACLAGLRAVPSAPGAFALGTATPPAPPRAAVPTPSPSAVWCTVPGLHQVEVVKRVAGHRGSQAPAR